MLCLTGYLEEPGGRRPTKGRYRLDAREHKPEEICNQGLRSRRGVNMISCINGAFFHPENATVSRTKVDGSLL